MAQKKKNGASKKATQTKSTPRKKEAGSGAMYDSSHVLHQIMPWILMVFALFLVICLFFTDYTGVVGKAIRLCLLGLLSGGAFAIPVILAMIAFFWKNDIEDNYLKYRITFALFVLLNVSVLQHAFTGQTDVMSLTVLWNDGLKYQGGGAIGGFCGSLLKLALGQAGLLIVSISMLTIFGIFLFGLTPRAIGTYISYYFHDRKSKYDERKNERALYKSKPEPYLPDDYLNNDKFEPDVPIDNEPVIDPKIFDNIVKANSEHPFIDEDITLTNDQIELIAAVENGKGKKKFPDHEGEVDLSSIFAEGSEEEFLKKFSGIPDTENNNSSAEFEISVERKKLIEEPSPNTPKKEIPKPEPPKYVFPPITLLNLDKKPKNTDVTDELQTNAKKLVETLASFKVHTKIVNISRGPTITRYELAPEEGVRVRSIANLVDDISLNLASSGGVRIEAPIPGKAAVGIEVPNKSVATVYLRELIESPAFKNNKSRITVSLGVDVAGSPIFVDIGKMPHLLIAGATGMGKSVCINSMIVSLLYKATPDEVKLILVDPKKVELNVYNGLPHLLVPVVSDPKKAAGSLHWAVTEMERRFELIESVGVRDIYNYNLLTKDDPSIEFMPHVLIIIDELADLMMTAPDDVEESICRLAQKARAAGMHLIIGTQRPSVDVITGLIKANIPSRIAFTVASQVDSRTIIDIAGAEKLIGRGDMLYAPVGASKPIRVQGAYVSEHEVEAITGFIKAKVGQNEYDSEVIQKIEKEAARCVQKKNSDYFGTDDNDPEADPMLQPAIELAVESGKISTSLIQRRLSLGYGRAAKLIDRMEQMGIVGPPEGNKPRDVLLTRQEYMEMVLNKE